MDIGLALTDGEEQRPVRRTLHVLAFLPVLSTMLAACGGDVARVPTATPAERKVVIGLSEPNAGWPYIAAFINAFKTAAAKRPNIDVVVLSADGNIAKQASDFDTLIAKKVDVILVCSLDGKAIVPSLKAAHDAGIAVLAVSNEPAPNGTQYIKGYSGPDDYEEGRIAAELLNDALGGKGNAVILEGTPGQSTTDARNRGFRDRLKELNSRIVILAKQTANWDPVQAKAVMEDFLTRYGDRINGLYSQDDNTAEAAAEVVRAAGVIDKIKIVGTGGSKNGIQAIKDGLIYGTTNQSPTADAEQALRFALDIATGKELLHKRNIIPMPKITQENSNQFVGEW